MNGYVRKRGDKWYYCFDIGTADGQRKRVERVGGKTKKECETKLRKALNEYETGYIEPSKMSLSDYLIDWLENFVKENRKTSTYNRYKCLIRNSVLPGIGLINLKDLKPKHIESMLSAEKKKGIGSTTIQHIYTVLNTALNRAVKLRILVKNPCDYVDRPKRVKFTANVLSVEEFYSLIDLLDVELYRDYIFSIALHIVLELGLRRGELSGLEWSNVNFKENTISITNNLVYTEGKTLLSTPKTEESKRILYISDDLKILLKNYKAIQNKNKLSFGPRVIKNYYNDRECDFVMTWENGLRLHPLYYTKKFGKLLKISSIDKKIRFHDLRHSNATLLLSQGVDFKTIQTRLGHANISTTLNIYSHVSLEMQKNAVDKLSSIFNGDKMATKKHSLCDQRVFSMVELTYKPGSVVG